MKDAHKALLQQRLQYSRVFGALGSFRIALHLNPRLSPSAMITYQATRPNKSEVFTIVRFGKVEDLIKALEAKTASLTDRDEEGRSLLNVSYYGSIFESSDPENSMRLEIRTLICASF